MMEQDFEEETGHEMTVEMFCNMLNISANNCSCDMNPTVCEITRFVRPNDTDKVSAPFPGAVFFQTYSIADQSEADHAIRTGYVLAPVMLLGLVMLLALVMLLGLVT